MTLDDTLADHKRKYTEHVHYSLQLKEQLNMVRQEAAIQVTKVKDFSECQKNKYNEYIRTLEQNLAECRALACSEFKKRENVSVYAHNSLLLISSGPRGAIRQFADR